MSNEIIFIIVALLDLAFVLFAFRIGKEWLFAAIVVNLILSNTFAGKLIPIFGLVTDGAAAFYASIFLATDMLTEHWGKKESRRAIWISFASMIAFVVLSNVVLRFSTISDTIVLHEAMLVVFKGVPRIAFASLLAYIVAQNFDVWFYHFIRRKTGDNRLWLRNNASTFTSQLLDSLIFFPVAFMGLVPFSVLLQILFTGYAIKLLVAMLDTPFMYLTYKIKK